jgi:hypothetical protein
MLVPVVRAGCNNDTHDKLTEEHAWDRISTIIVVDVMMLEFTYQHYLQELEACGRPCPAA